MIKADFKYNDLELEIIDILRKGNLIRFYLGKKEDKWGYTNPDYKDSSGNTPEWLQPSETYYGDDWDDAPYDCNAGPVYEEFVKGYIDIAFDFDCRLLEPITPDTYKYWCKYDMVAKKIPCLIVLPANYEFPETYYNTDEHGCYAPTFDFFNKLKDDKIVKIYFGDNIKKILAISEREDL